MSDDLDFDYAIGMQELCQLLGVTPNTIRNYDKYNAIHSRRSENGYRYYWFNDILQCLKLKSYTSLGLTIKEASELSMKADYDDVQLKLQHLLRQKEREMQLLAMQQEFIRDFQQDLEFVRSLDGRVIEIERPGLYWLNCQNEGAIRRDDVFKRMISKWSRCVPFVQSCNTLKDHHLGPSSVCEIGYCIKEKYVKLFQGLELEHTAHFASCKCLMTAVHANAAVRDYYSVIQPIVNYLETHHLRLTDSIICIPVATDMAVSWRADVYFDYHLCYFCVE